VTPPQAYFDPSHRIKLITQPTPSTNHPPLQMSSTTVSSYAPGDLVTATWKGRGRYHAFVEAVNGEDSDTPTYVLVYEDGDIDRAAKPEYIVSRTGKLAPPKPTAGEAAGEAAPANEDGENKATEGPVKFTQCSNAECAKQYIEWRRRCPSCETQNPKLIVPHRFGGFFNPIDFEQMRIQSAERDAGRFRAGYPGLEDDPDANLNVKFFSNEIAMVPDGYKIEEFLEKWKGKYARLEHGHAFIQWIFPIREQGLNPQAQPLQKWEADKIASTPVMQDRLIRLYELMLDFYGMRLVNRVTGEVARNEIWRDRYANLEHHPHNFLRITRILKCLHECGLGRYQKPFVKHVLTEIYQNRELTACEESAKLYWVSVVVNDQERDELRNYIAERVATRKQARTEAAAALARTPSQ